MKTHYEMMMEYNLFPFKEQIKIFRHIFNSKPITYEQMINSRIGQEIIESSSDLIPQTEVATCFAILFHIYHFELYHKKLYSISNDLAEMLFHTKLSKVPLILVKSPYPEILLEIPPTFLTIMNQYTGEHNVTNIYVNLQERSEQDKELRICVVGIKNNSSIDTYDDALFYFKLLFKDDDLEAEVERCVLSDSKVGDVFVTEQNNKKLRLVFNFVLNCLLYITGAESDIKLISKRKEIEAKLARCKGSKRKKYERQLLNSGLDKYVVGSNIKLTREEKEWYKEERSNVPKGKLTVRTLVQGHWRNQAYGESRSLRKALWIKPFWRGPSLGAIVHNKHIVGS